jgi:hypothetical protein
LQNGDDALPQLEAVAMNSDHIINNTATIILLADDSDVKRTTTVIDGEVGKVLP